MENQPGRFEQTDQRHNFYDTAIKAITACAAVFVGLFGVVQYNGIISESEKNRKVALDASNKLQAADLERRRLDAAKPLNDLRLKIYSDAVESIADYANLKEGSADWKTARARFLTLYYGDMSLVESKPVASAMYKAWQIIYITPTDTKSLGDETTQQLNQIAEEVSKAGRQDLEQLKD